MTPRTNQIKARYLAVNDYVVVDGVTLGIKALRKDAQGVALKLHNYNTGEAQWVTKNLDALVNIEV